MNREQIALLLPLYLHQPRTDLVKDANEKRAKLKEAWPSLHLANWLNETAARATTVDKITEHLKQQRDRRTHDKELQKLYEEIEERLGKPLESAVAAAFEDTAKRVAQEVSQQDAMEYVPDKAWLDQEQLTLARVYISALVNWRRIDMSLTRENEI